MRRTPLHPRPPRSRRRQGREEKAGPRGRRRRGRRRRRRLNKSKAGSELLPSFPSPPDPGLHPPTACTAFVTPPPALSSFYWGKTVLEGWAKWSCIVIKPPPHGTESHPTTLHPPAPPTPRFSGVPALSIPQFHC